MRWFSDNSDLEWHIDVSNGHHWVAHIVLLFLFIFFISCTRNFEFDLCKREKRTMLLLFFFSFCWDLTYVNVHIGHIYLLRLSCLSISLHEVSPKAMLFHDIQLSLPHEVQIKKNIRTLHQHIKCNRIIKHFHMINIFHFKQKSSSIKCSIMFTLLAYTLHITVVCQNDQHRLYEQ